jgi:hypothetical protein
MTASTTTGGGPFVVGLGGTLRANSSTELVSALRDVDAGVQKQLYMLATQVLAHARAAWGTS